MVAIAAPASPAAPEELSESVSAVAASDVSNGSDEGGANWPDEAAESSFLAEARDRGEKVVAPKVADDAAEETDTKALPPLNELVARIPADVRETLDELFRARFVTVKRVPRKALKSAREG